MDNIMFRFEAQEATACTGAHPTVRSLEWQSSPVY